MEIALYAARVWATTAPARTSSGRAGTSPRRRRSRGCSAPAWPGNAPRSSALWDAAPSWKSAPAAAVWRPTSCRAGELGCAPERYFVLEVSADLRERQRRQIVGAVPRLARRVEWLDAPPGHRLRRRRARERGAGCAAGDALSLASREGGDARSWASRARASGSSGRPARGRESLAAECARLAEAGGGWEDGLCLGVLRAAHRVDGRGHGGAPRGPRAMDRLRLAPPPVLFARAARRHPDLPFPPARDRGSLFAPGLEDITAWVDFTRLAQASAARGYELAGYTTQAHFLAGLAIDAEMHHLAGEDPSRFARLANEARTLMLPGEMGERFKAMAWMRGMECAAAGISRCRTCATRLAAGALRRARADLGPGRCGSQSAP